MEGNKDYVLNHCIKYTNLVIKVLKKKILKKKKRVEKDSMEQEDS